MKQYHFWIILCMVFLAPHLNQTFARYVALFSLIMGTVVGFCEYKGWIK